MQQNVPCHFDGPSPSRDQSLTWTIVAGLRRATLRIGMRYVVSTGAEQGRPCELLEVDDSKVPRQAYVRFVDEHGGHGEVPVIELGLLQLGA